MFANLKTLIINRYKSFIFNRILRGFSKLNFTEMTDIETISKLYYYFGNCGWSAKPEYLLTCIKYAIDCNGPILELGSGLSTLIIGIIAKKKHIEMTSLENNLKWSDNIIKLIDKYKLDNIVIINPLKDYGEYEWYNPDFKKTPSFNLVICDGPPSTTKGGRYGFLPIMKESLSLRAVIIVDDTIRIEERDIVKRWAEIIEFDEIQFKNNSPHSVLILR